MNHFNQSDNLVFVRREINGWSRHELQTYLEENGYQVYDHESDTELRDCVFQHAKTEGQL